MVWADLENALRGLLLRALLARVQLAIWLAPVSTPFRKRLVGADSILTV